MLRVSRRALLVQGTVTWGLDRPVGFLLPRLEGRPPAWLCSSEDQPGHAPLFSPELQSYLSSHLTTPTVYTAGPTTPTEYKSDQIIPSLL